jgi:DNA-binding MarR family transcriptional regulator
VSIRSPDRPSWEQLAVWRTFLRAHATVTRVLEAELLSEVDLPLAWYDVLVQLVEAPEYKLRMTDLADRLLLSRSGVSRLVDRMTRDGLVRRATAPHDGRVTYAVLTPAGMTRLREAAPVHLRGVAAHVTSRLSDEQLSGLADALTSVLEPWQRSKVERVVPAENSEPTVAAHSTQARGISSVTTGRVRHLPRK